MSQKPRPIIQSAFSMASNPAQPKLLDHRETELMLKGYGLTTAIMYYRMPDYQRVLNEFIWQDYDLSPDYPRLFDFIEFWQENIEGPLHSVEFTHRKLISPGEWRNVVGEYRLN